MSTFGLAKLAFMREMSSMATSNIVTRCSRVYTRLRRLLAVKMLSMPVIIRDIHKCVFMLVYSVTE